MGVPSFFRWLAKKYPKVLVNVVEQYPKRVGDTEVQPDTSQSNPNGVEYDCLYLDMNGIIHPCSHPENKEQPKDEHEIMKAIFDYIDRLFNIVRPRRLLYMAIDGVAPRAKMNQQRSRRFKSARDAKEKAVIEEDIRRELAENGLLDPNESVEPTQHWDSNQITPGTPFMQKVAESLRYYIVDRITNDPGWAKLTVVLSDSNMPGEGEHKLMEYIRYQHIQEGYNANTRHCVYGLDADLIMLSLATHEPHFSLLREDVLINNDNKNPVKFDAGASKEEIYKHQPFQFLQINVLREYLEWELKPKDPIKFTWDFERAVDDFVFLCFFVGNDFLPHLPTLEIREGAISMLMELYRKTLPMVDGYITENGQVSFERAEKLLLELAPLEEGILRKRKEREKRFQAERKEKAAMEKKERETRDKPVANVDESNEAAAEKLRLLLGGTSSQDNNDGESQSQPDKPEEVSDENQFLESIKSMKGKEKVKAVYKKREEDLARQREDLPDEIALGSEGWRQRYYKAKFNVTLEEADFFYNLTQKYAEGLQWVLNYYYQGCCSWKWFYPFHYAPFVQEIAKVASHKIEFEKDTKPFTPFQQLLSVLPSASAKFLPSCYAALMTDPNSLISDFYPEDFPVDMEGKKFSWQGIAILPFLDEERLLTASANLDQHLTVEEAVRNGTGCNFIFCHKNSPLGLQIQEAKEKDVKLKINSSVEFFGYVSKETSQPTSSASTTTNLSVMASPVNGVPDLFNYQAVWARYDLPDLPSGHQLFQTRLCPGLVMPAPILSPMDYREDRGFRIGEAGNRFARRSFGENHVPHARNYGEGGYSGGPGGRGYRGRDNYGRDGFRGRGRGRGRGNYGRDDRYDDDGRRDYGGHDEHDRSEYDDRREEYSRQDRFDNRGQNSFRGRGRDYGSNYHDRDRRDNGGGRYNERPQQQYHQPQPQPQPQPHPQLYQQQNIQQLQLQLQQLQQLQQQLQQPVPAQSPAQAPLPGLGLPPLSQLPQLPQLQQMQQQLQLQQIQLLQQGLQMASRNTMLAPNVQSPAVFGNGFTFATQGAQQNNQEHRGTVRPRDGSFEVPDPKRRKSD